MKKGTWAGIVAGCVAGLIGSILVSEFDFSIFSVGVIGLIIGALMGVIFNYFSK